MAKITRTMLTPATSECSTATNDGMSVCSSTKTAQNFLARGDSTKVRAAIVTAFTHHEFAKAAAWARSGRRAPKQHPLVLDDTCPGPVGGRRGKHSGRKKSSRWRFLCKHCDKAITDSDVKKGNVYETTFGVFHKDHLTCCQCGTSFWASQTPFVEKSQQYYCYDCHLETENGNCVVCQTPFFTRCIEVNGRRVHAACFTCARCGGPFPEGKHIFHNRRFFDIDCFYLRVVDLYNPSSTAVTVPSPPQIAAVSDSSTSQSTTTPPTVFGTPPPVLSTENLSSPPKNEFFSRLAGKPSPTPPSKPSNPDATPPVDHLSSGTISIPGDLDQFMDFATGPATTPPHSPPSKEPAKAEKSVPTPAVSAASASTPAPSAAAQPASTTAQPTSAAAQEPKTPPPPTKLPATSPFVIKVIPSANEPPTMTPTPASPQTPPPAVQTESFTQVTTTSTQVITAPTQNTESLTQMLSSPTQTSLTTQPSLTKQESWLQQTSLTPPGIKNKVTPVNTSPPTPPNQPHKQLFSPRDKYSP